MQKQTLETRLLKRIERKRSDVFLLADFKDLADYDQVGRGLRKLIRKGRLIKIGMGLYVRAGASPFDGRPAPVKGLRSLTVEALGRLGVETKPTRLERAYNAGRTTQVPAGRVVAVTKRVRRKIGFDGNYVRFERA